MLNSDDLSKLIGSRLKELRDDSDASMEEECAALNQKFNLKIGKGMMSRWETGKSQPTNIFLCAYALHHNVDLNYLVGLSNERKPLIADNENNCQVNLETELIYNFRLLNSAGQNIVIGTVIGLVNNENYRADSNEKKKTGT